MFVGEENIPVRASSTPAEPDVEPTKEDTPGKAWFLKDGQVYPTPNKGPVRLFPDQADGDRIVDQLMYIPEDYQG